MVTPTAIFSLVPKLLFAVTCSCSVVVTIALLVARYDSEDVDISGVTLVVVVGDEDAVDDGATFEDLGPGVAG